ncbi:MAG: 3',5'-cyclic-AMP phosphodiesterase [Gammaproteobacteria bacterium]|jgi:Icc protein
MGNDAASAQAGPLRIAQITDTHLYADPAGRLLGLNTRRCLEAVIELALQGPRIDLVVASGDLSHDGTPEAYRRLRRCFARAGVPVYCLPGNHDDPATLHQQLNQDDFHSIPELRCGGWQLVFLDSTLAGSEGGHLAAAELTRLDRTLGERSEAPALVWLHHQPVDIGSRWMDTMKVDNPAPFFEILDRHPQVRAVIWGHVHQVFDERRGDVRLLATPSTCVQFLPASETFAVDLIPPGYRWLELRPDGTFTTGIERLSRIPGRIDLSERGY